MNKSSLINANVYFNGDCWIGSVSLNGNVLTFSVYPTDRGEIETVAEVLSQINRGLQSLLDGYRRLHNETNRLPSQNRALGSGPLPD